MIAVDTNVLVYAHREEFPQHRAAARWVVTLGEGSAPWGIPIFVIGEFLRIMTHPQVLHPPVGEDAALDALDEILGSPSLRVLSPGTGYLPILRDTVLESRARGNVVIDAQIAAVCLEHGATEILTEDRDFGRFKGIRIRRLA